MEGFGDFIEKLMRTLNKNNRRLDDPNIQIKVRKGPHGKPDEVHFRDERRDDGGYDQKIRKPRRARF